MSAVQSLRMRADRWHAWTVLLTRLHSRLRYTALPIQQLLAELSGDSDLSALLWLQHFASSKTAPVCPAQGLLKEEQAFAQALFAGFGVTDLEGQLSHLEVFLQQAKEREAAARTDLKTNAKVYGTGGICAGLSLALLLI